jgi:hypothetical protein
MSNPCLFIETSSSKDVARNVDAPPRRSIRSLASQRRNRHGRIQRKRPPLHRPVCFPYLYFDNPHANNTLPSPSGSNYVQGSLNWGPAPNLNGVSKSYSWWTERRRGFNQDFRTYALEWTPDFLYVLPFLSNRDALLTGNGVHPPADGSTSTRDYTRSSTCASTSPSSNAASSPL